MADSLTKAKKAMKFEKSAKLYNPYEGQLFCRQLSEIVIDFISRLITSVV